MKKTTLAGAMALSLGTITTNASAIAIDITAMHFGSTSAVSGVADSDNLGTTFNGTFFGEAWVATTMAAFTTAGGHAWVGVSPEQGTFSYNFSIAAGEVAFGIFFDWSVNLNIPVLPIFSCVGIMDGDACTPISSSANAMPVGPFPGGQILFSGTVSAVPVPAAVWLFGSGLLGLVGFGRYRKE